MRDWLPRLVTVAVFGLSVLVAPIRVSAKFSAALVTVTLVMRLLDQSTGKMFPVDWSNNRITKVTVTSAALNFADTRIGATSTDSPKTATVTNLGNQCLIFSANPSYTVWTENTNTIALL